MFPCLILLVAVKRERTYLIPQKILILPFLEELKMYCLHAALLKIFLSQVF